VNDRPDSIGEDDPYFRTKRLKSDHCRVRGRGISLSPSASPKSDLEFPQAILDMVACIQGKVANTREQPADPDQ
jgi:hypothetical protein